MEDPRVITGHPKLVRAARSSFWPAAETKTPPGSALGSSMTIAPQSSGRGSSVGIMVQRQISCPKLSDTQISELDCDVVQTITKHLDAKYLESAVNGYFQFGTIEEYRATERIPGRFGDMEEGSQWDVLKSPDGNFDNVRIDGLKIGSFSSNVENPIVVSVVVNDYCSCASLGNFDAQRSDTLKAKGNDKLGAFVTYDLAKLKGALREIIAETPETAHYRLFGRVVDYSQKDRHWMIEGQFEHNDERSPIATWLSTAFVKNPAYEHEEEFRILIIDPAHAGGLHKETKARIFEDKRIANSIVASGVF